MYFQAEGTDSEAEGTDSGCTAHLRKQQEDHDGGSKVNEGKIRK